MPDEVQHFDVSRLAESKRVRRTQIGGIRIPARLARTGILEYRPIGETPRRELRLPEEVFDNDSLASLNGAPVIDFVDHTALVTPEDFRGKVIGHVENVHIDGDFVCGDLVINDSDAIANIDRGERSDISAGYVSKDKRTPGTWRGQHYDRVQRGIRYNHVALCPPNRGRSGPEVGIRLDSMEYPMRRQSQEIVFATTRLDALDPNTLSETDRRSVSERLNPQEEPKPLRPASDIAAKARGWGIDVGDFYHIEQPAKKARAIALALVQKALPELHDKASRESDAYVGGLFDVIADEPVKKPESQQARGTKGTRSETPPKGKKWDPELGYVDDDDDSASTKTDVTDEVTQRFRERQATQWCTTDHERATVMERMRQQDRFNAEQRERRAVRLDTREPTEAKEVTDARAAMIKRNRAMWQEPPQGGGHAA
jgi:hypothetical protein